MNAAREPLITPAQLAEILQVSLNTARRIMREQGAISVGAQLRWTATKLERYLRMGGSGCTDERRSNNDSSNEAASGPSKDTTTPANDTRRAPIRAIAKPRLKLLAASSENDPFLRPIRPRRGRKDLRSDKR